MLFHSCYFISDATRTSTRRMALVLQGNFVVCAVVPRAHLVTHRTDNLTHLYLGVCPILEIDTIIGLDSMEDWSGTVSSALRSPTLNQWENRYEILQLKFLDSCICSKLFFLEVQSNHRRKPKLN